ncbi:transcription factor [Ganoderma sinense ZZ0214-1]|uniref:Transcription factor n=1 Tax=Ganoderma sinense ZZ0214-1 TaxID=1077348 RepID=A0A2G8RXW2_9APHY|nr:transcription factor [Ganoderma sinense ZZ0214-1]
MSHTSLPVPSSSKSKSNFESILAGRKCYRMSKEKNEVVWPPHLEQALMEGLEKYTPAESKSPRGLTRFPNRNKFIAEYILKKTGEIRTAKQVGSRIQQLRDTSAGKTIMKAISDRHYEMMHPTRPNEPAQDMAMSDVYFNGTMVPPMNQVIHVYISVSSAAWTDAYPQPTRPTEVNVLSSSAYSWGEARPLRTIDPTVTFTSPALLTLYSSFTVYYGSTVMHIDQPTPMRSRSSEEYGSGPYLHYTSLAPGYWENLCLCTDLSQYVIVQEITKQPAAPTEKPIPVMRIHYHFNTAPSVPPLSPFALHDDDLEVDYETDELLASHTHTHAAHAALSTSSASPYPSDRSSSPSYSVPGFCSQPLSPVDWTGSSSSSSGASAAWGFPASSVSVSVSPEGPCQVQLPLPVQTAAYGHHHQTQVQAQGGAYGHGHGMQPRGSWTVGGHSSF